MGIYKPSPLYNQYYASRLIQEYDRFLERFRKERKNTVHKLYDYAVILQEKEEDDKVSEEAKIVVPPTTVLAKHEQEVQMKAARAIPEEYMDRIDRLTVVVRPF